MTGNTGYTAPVAGDSPNGPEQMTTIYEHFDPLVDGSAATKTDFVSGAWVGQRMLAQDTGVLYWWSGASWVTVKSVLKLALPKTITQNGNTTLTKITWSASAAPVDIGGFYSTATTSRITAPVAGTYRFQLHVQSQISSATRTIGYGVNGTHVAVLDYDSGTASTFPSHDVQLVLTMSGGDYVEFEVTDTTTGLNITSNQTSVYAELIA